MQLLEVGKKAPAFKLKNQRDEWVSLSGLKGQRVVLYFYPKALTPGCTVQACGLRDTKKELASRGAIAIGVSPDPVARLEKFEQKHELNFDLLSDEDHQLAEKYGVWGLKKFMGREFMGVNRVTYIIDENGKIAEVFPKVKTKTHHDDVLAALDALSA